MRYSPSVHEAPKLILTLGNKLGMRQSDEIFRTTVPFIHRLFNNFCYVIAAHLIISHNTLAFPHKQKKNQCLQVLYTFTLGDITIK